MLNEKQSPESDYKSIDEIATISGEYWDETSWLSSTGSATSLKDHPIQVPEDEIELFKPSRQSGLVSTFDGRRTVAINRPETNSTPSQTRSRNRSGRLFIHVLAPVITVICQLFESVDERRGNLSLLLAGFYATMFTIDSASARLDTLGSTTIMDLFNQALNISACTFQFVLCDIVSDGWKILTSEDYRDSLQHRIQLVLLFQTEGWIISKVVQSQLQAVGLSLTAIYIQVIWNRF